MVIDAALVVVNPLLIKHLLDDGILGKDTTLVIWLALAMALVSILDAALGVASGYLSSRIGESLIFDLRTKVFAHVQRMSLAFFTRTQTGALVSRLNNDVIGAQRAFTSTLSGTVSNSISVVVVGITMFALSWQVTLACLALFPLLLLASRWVGRQISGLTRRQMDGNADLGNLMTERFNVGGALLLKLFGRRDEEDAKYAEKAGLVRDLGIRISLITRVFMAIDDADPGAGDRARLRHRRHPRDQRRADHRHADRARHPAAAAARPAPGALQRPRRRDDRAGQLRPRLRGARPALDRGREARCRDRAGDGHQRRVRRGRLHLPARRRGLAGQPRDGGARRRAATTARCSTA